MAKYFDYIFRLPFTHQAVIDVHTYQIVTDCFQKQSSHYRTVNSTWQSQQYFLIPYLALNQLDLIVHKVRHVPVSLSFASIEDERFHCILDSFNIVCKLCQFHCTSRLIVTGCHDRDTHCINRRIHINGNTVNHIVRSAIDNNTLYVGQCFQFFHCDVVRINLTIHS